MQVTAITRNVTRLFRFGHTPLGGVYRGENEPKTLSYADDITIIVSTEESIHRTIAKYESFAKTYGITLNIEKTEILTAGVVNQKRKKI